MALPALAPYLLWRRLSRGKYAESAGGMLGKRLPAGAEADVFKNGSLWVHAVSVGEIAAAKAVVPGLKGLVPECPALISTITETGQAAAQRTFPGDSTTYFPADFSPNVRRFLDVYRPKCFVLMETELWPNFLTMAAARGVQCFMINAKVSDRSFPRYKAGLGVIGPAFRALAGVCAQTKADAERFAALGVPRERIVVTGNCKFDLSAEALDDEAKTAMFVDFGMSPARRWIVAGSTHPGEEELILKAFEGIHATRPDTGLVICPRHPERFDEVYKMVSESPLKVSRASQISSHRDPDIVLLDRMGVLAKSYGLGEIAIVAGSFCPVGGHNLLEAAAHGVPVVYGPQMHSQREIQRIFTQTGAGEQTSNENLAQTLSELLDNAEKRIKSGRQSLNALELNRGSAERATNAIAGWIKNRESEAS